MPRPIREQTLLGDIGATNARFSLLANGTLGPVTTFEVARYARFPDVVAVYLNMHRDQMPVTRALLAAAGPVEGERSKLTNCSWIIDADELRRTFRLAEVRVVNDFAATAYSLPRLTAADLHRSGARAVPGARWRCWDPGPVSGSLAWFRAQANRCRCG
jgi:glucokinase